MAKKPTKKELEKLAKQEAEAAALAAEAQTSQDAPAQDQGPLLRILAQYVKDASFENPNAPASLRAGQEQPAIDINVEVKGAPIDQTTAEVTLIIGATAKRGDETAFICELEYSGLFAFANVPADQLQALLLIECPRLIFPFARQIICDLTQQGGFPPLMLEPLDFAQLFRQQNGGEQTIN